MQNTLADLWANTTLWIPLSAMAGVQLFKFFWEGTRNRSFDIQVLMRAGGMPSSHSALVTSLATTTGVVHGLDSPSFATAIVLALIVMYDARGVRQESGKQARVLNQIVRELFRGQPINEQELKELLGHTATEVVVGALVGIVYAFGTLALWG
jgi:acid phosphatase family membrane protein YuiD